MSGYIRLSRKFFNNVYWSQKRTFSLSEAWLDLIQLARFDAEPTNVLLSNGREITIERGEIHASLRFLSSRWSWSVDKTKRFIDKHKAKQEIVHRTEQGESIIKLCNYDIYNPVANTSKYTKPNTDQYTDQTPTSTNNNKEKKVNKEKEINIAFDFENIWNIYEKKGNKKTSMLKWNNLKDSDKGKALSHMPRYVDSTPDRKFRKNLETYLNQECWDDEIIYLPAKEQEQPTYKLLT